MEFDISPEQALELEASDKILSPGWYGFECENLEDKISNAGNPMVLVRAKGIEGEAKAVTVFINVTPAFGPIFRGFTQAMGGTIDSKTGKSSRLKFDNAGCKGKKFAAFILEGNYEGTPKNEVKKIMPYAELVNLRKSASSAAAAAPKK